VITLYKWRKAWRLQGELVPASDKDSRVGRPPTSSRWCWRPRACLRERISKGRRQHLILHADNGNAMRVATLESQLEELGVLRYFARPRVSDNNPYKVCSPTRLFRS